MTSWTPRKHRQQNLILFPISPLRNCSTPAQDSHTPGHMMWVVALWVHTIGMWKQMSAWYPKQKNDIPCIPCYWYYCSNPRQGRATAQMPCQKIRNKGIHSCCPIFKLFNTRSCWESEGTKVLVRTYRKTCGPATAEPIKRIELV